MPITRRHLLASAWPGFVAAVPHPARAAVRAAPPALALPGLYTEAADPAAYLVSEKYDGVRGFWDGSTLRHRSGRVVPAPAWFSARLPRGLALDGELWLARGHFDALSGVVRKAVPVDAEWRALRFMVFELPAAHGPFSERAAQLAALARDLAWPQLLAVEQTPVADRAALKRRLASTVARGGEGLVLHRADAEYQTGRTSAMLKLKPELDAEAVVVGHSAGSGRHQGRLGALEVETPEGLRFFVGSGFSDRQREAPPAPGTTVTYRYRDLTPGGVPRFATFVRVHETL